jgi:hypothetical protein
MNSLYSCKRDFFKRAALFFPTTAVSEIVSTTCLPWCVFSIGVQCTMYITVQYSTVQYITLHYITVQYITVQYITVQYSKYAERVAKSEHHCMFKMQ